MVRLPGLVIIASLLLLALWKIPQLQVSGLFDVSDQELFSLRDATRRTIAQIIAGTLLFVGAYFAWRRIAAMEEGTEVERQGQITDRYIRVVEQLGSGSFQVRIGAIYALERIARNSRSDHGPIMEMLTAFVSERSTTGRQLRSEPEADVVTALKVITRRNRTIDVDTLEIRGAHLRGVNLSTRSLGGIDFVDTNLSHAVMYDADLADSGFYASDLTSSVLAESRLVGGVFGGRNFNDTGLHRTNLKGVDLSGVTGLEEDQLRVAINDDETTILPRYLSRM